MGPPGWLNRFDCGVAGGWGGGAQPGRGHHLRCGAGEPARAAPDRRRALRRVRPCQLRGQGPQGLRDGLDPGSAPNDSRHGRYVRVGKLANSNLIRGGLVRRDRPGLRRHIAGSPGLAEDAANTERRGRVVQDPGPLRPLAHLQHRVAGGRLRGPRRAGLPTIETEGEAWV
jgi:hypothetical protein